ncbi:MAG: AAA family ATPase [Clostridium sp.]|nr:AAA family ATPase [Clostridium sp.]MCM1172871.1 AAA family ATPase [Clostridium sp.]
MCGELDKVIQKDKTFTIRMKIAIWLRNHDFSQLYEYVAERVRGQEEVKNVVANVYNYFLCLAGERQHHNNMLIAAPSGCGKTETYRILREYFSEEIPELPISQIDLTSITMQGYKGLDTEDIIVDLFAHDGTDGIGIVFLDEFDKKLVPYFDSEGRNTNRDIQTQILTLIEGRVAYNKKGTKHVNTSNTLFIGLGSFDMIRNEREDAKNGIGFGAQEGRTMDHYDDITEEEILNMGGCEELIGRFYLLVNYKKLTPKIIDEIINRTIEEIEKQVECHITLTEKRRRELQELANGRFGCRIFEKTIKKEIMPILADMWMNKQKGIDIVLGNEESVSEEDVLCLEEV